MNIFDKIKKIKIGCHTYKLKKLSIERSQREEIQGCCDVNTLEIYIDPRLTGSVLLETLFHEILHALYHGWGLNTPKLSLDEELIVNVLTPAILTMLKDNPKLAELFLNASLKSKR